MAKEILTGENARNAILRGFNQVADIVGATLGPRSGTVVLGRPFGAALVTKDGVTVAESISVADPFENEGAKLIQEAARKTNQEAGDGTTAATILTRAIFREGVKVVAAGANAMAIERGIQKGVAAVVEELAKLAQPVDQEDLDAIRKVATISANGDAEMGDVIARAVSRVGLEGVVMVSTSPTLETTLEISPGLRFDRGMVAAQFMNNPARGEAVYENCNIFITDMRMIAGDRMAAFLQVYVGMFGAQAPLLIIAEDIAEGALQLLNANNGRSCMVVPVKTPGSGASKKDEIEDIAVWTGARAYMVVNGDDVTKARKEDFGFAQRVIVTPRSTTIVGGKGQPIRIETRKDEIRSRIADPEAKEFERAQLERRLALLSASVAVIKIGSSVHSKLLEKRDRVEDAVNATKAALKEGIVPGGGVALIRCLPAVEKARTAAWTEEAIGIDIVAKALTHPLHRLAENSGKSGDVIVEKVIAGHPALDSEGRISIGGHAGSFVSDGGDYPKGEGSRYANPAHYGYNAATDRFEFLVEAGIIDPAKVVRLALQNAAELAGLLLTSAAVVVELPEPKQQTPGGSR